MKHSTLNAILSPLIGFAVCILIIVFCGNDPKDAITSLFTQVFTSRYYFGSMLNTASFLMIAGCGASLALKGGNMNLGGEGQIYLGGYLTALVLTSGINLPPVLKMLLALTAALAGGALLAMISALLKELRGTEVLLTSFLASAAVIPLIDGFITGSSSYRQSPNLTQNLLALPYISESFKLKQILSPSPLTVSFFAAIIFCLALWLFLRGTNSGRKLQVWGMAPEFALYSGYSSKKISYITLAVSGALHALTGFFAVCGTYYTCHKGFYSGMGWNALSASLIVSADPLLLIPSSLVLGWLYTSADFVGLTQGFSFDISGIVQGCVLMAIAIPLISKNKSQRRQA